MLEIKRTLQSCFGCGRNGIADDLKQRFTFVTKCSSHVSDYQNKFHCKICNTNVTLAHGGANVITRHAETPEHKKYAEALKGMCLDC